jgi:hypothetical protein
LSELVVESRPDPLRSSVPVRFGPPGGRFEEVEAVLDCWPGEGHRYFRVRVRGGAEYILRHDLARGAWRVDVFWRGVAGVS